MVISIEDLNRYKPMILFVELAALLHDIGKLSSNFVEYRQKWQKEKGGWDNDPHEKWFLDSDAYETLSNVPEKFNQTLEELGLSFPFAVDVSKPDASRNFCIKKAVHEHNDGNNADILIRVLKTADSNDSAVDRNNPLFSAEQSQDGPVYKSNVFGYEAGAIKLKKLDSAREELYSALTPLLDNYLTRNGKGFAMNTRRDILEQVQKAFIEGLSDTTRPQNDTSLWEHAYAVASIAKVLTLHNLFCDPKITSAFDSDFQYGILGVGWDGMNFLSYSQKIGDITARKRIIEEIKTGIQNLLEHQYSVGNSIYDDDDGIYFIVPSHFTPEKESSYKDICAMLEKEIQQLVYRKSHGEIQPYFESQPECAQLTALVNVIEKLRKKRAFWFDNSQPHCINQLAFAKDREICSICRLRPVRAKKEDEKICETCDKRRKESSKRNSPKENRQTVFIDEIVDDNQRAALIAARFDLKHWLDGKMIRTLFVTEAHGIEREVESLNEIEDFKNDGSEARVKEILISEKHNADYNYEHICQDIDELIQSNEHISQHALRIAFLYIHGRKGKVPLPKDDPYAIEGLKKFIAKCKKELGFNNKEIWPYNVINAKSPTPSTLLNVWQTTRRFFEQETATVIAEECPSIGRIRLQLSEPVTDVAGGTCKARLDDKKVELLFSDPEHAELIVNRKDTNTFDEKFHRQKKLRLTITDKSYVGTQKKFEVTRTGASLRHAYRIITASPYVFMAIVPADKAIVISEKIYRKYQAQFGKVTGRLPFSMGNIFFKRRMPMFIVLDAARRMLDRFRSQSQKDRTVFIVEAIKKPSPQTAGGGEYRMKVHAKGKSSIQWHLPMTLGNLEDDFYHPYCFIADEPAKYANRKGFFRTIAGDVIPFQDMKIGDKVSVYPNYFDFVFLDSNQKRHEAYGGEQVRDLLFFMEELEQKLIHIWDKLIKGGGLKGMTQAKLKNIQALWESKFLSWGGARPEFERLVAATLKKEFFHIDEEHEKLILETVKSSLFFRMLELQQGILKDKVQPAKK